jgi:glycerophosphoryl diester phosphodiesterase
MAAGANEVGGRATRRRWTLAVVVAAVVIGGCSSSDGDGEAAKPTTTTVPATTTTTEPPALDPPTHPWVVGHRGSAAQAPENTFASFDLAVEHEADHLEVDLQLTSDGKLVVLHDPTLERTARGPAEACTGPIDTRTLAQVTTCDAGTWFNETYPELADPAFADQRIPSFDEVLERYGTDVRWYIETKKLVAGEGMEAAMVASLDAAGFTADAPATAQIVIQSFDAESLLIVHELRPDLVLNQLLSLEAPRDAAALDAVADYATGITPNWLAVDEALIAAARERCLTVIPYTVDEPADMDRLLDLGVDGIITNRPDVLRPRVLDRPVAAPCPAP